MTAPDVTPEMVLAMKQEIDDLRGNVIALQQFANTNDIELLKSQIEMVFDTKIKTAMATAARPTFDGEQSCYKPILEAIQDIPAISYAKGYRSWKQKMK